MYVYNKVGLSVIPDLETVVCPLHQTDSWKKAIQRVYPFTNDNLAQHTNKRLFMDLPLIHTCWV